MGTNSKSNEYKAYNDGTDKLNQVINRVINKQAIFEANKPHLDSGNPFLFLLFNRIPLGLNNKENEVVWKSKTGRLGLKEEDIKGSNTILCFFLITFHITKFKVLKAGFLISENVQSGRGIWKRGEDG